MRGGERGRLVPAEHRCCLLRAERWDEGGGRGIEQEAVWVLWREMEAQAGGAAIMTVVGGLTSV